MIGARTYNYRVKKDCVYKGERYTARDNGAVYRHVRNGKKKRRLDERWTFGRPNSKTGYMEIASVRVHRIVALAFHGEPPTSQHVVDHIDTNRRNNRPDNLRWVTRLENVLLNPITVNRIEYSFGSIENFINMPSGQHNNKGGHNYRWMRPVNPREAQLSFTRLLESVEKNKPLAGGALGEWIYHPSESGATTDESLEDQPAITLNAVQRRWTTACEYMSCPQNPGESPILEYEKRLSVGCVFCQNDFKKSIVEQFAASKDVQTLWVLCHFDREAMKPWSLAKVTYENGQYVHENLGSFFMQDGAEKQFTLAQGLEWAGGITFDECC
jgi:hypothetical protein